MRTCYMCQVEKEDDCFAFRNKKKGTKQTHCRDCQKVYRRQHYLLNKQKYIAKARKIGDAAIEENYCHIFEYLKCHPCVDCGENDVRVLEFDHIDPLTKKKEVSAMISYPFHSIMEEIIKCEVRCANCHRIKTLNGYRKDRPYQKAYNRFLSAAVA